MNSQCVIFAESEVVNLIHAKTDKSDISKAIHDSIAGRVGSMIRQIGVNGDVALLGGVGYNPGLLEAMSLELKIEIMFVPDEPEFGAAVGAAFVAAEDHHILAIKGTANLRQELLLLLEKNENAVLFEFEEDKMYSQRESELIQNYLQEYGKMPGIGADDLDELY